MDEKTLIDNPDITKTKNIKIKKYLLIILLFLALFFAYTIINDIYAITYNSKFTAIDNSYKKIPATVIAENPLRKDALDFIEPRRDFIGKADELNKIIDNIDKCLDRKFDFDEHTKTRLWKQYSKLRQNLDELSAIPSSSAEKPDIKIPELFFTGEWQIFYISTLINRAKVSALMALIAIEKKDYGAALRIDAALMRLARAAAVANFNLPSLIGVMVQYETANFAAKGPARIYLECDDALLEPHMAAVKAALKSREESLRLFFNIRDAIRLESALMFAQLSVMRSFFYTAMKLLDLWYEKPEAFYKGFIAIIDSIPEEQYAKLTKAAKEYFSRCSEFDEPGLNRFLKIHPLFYKTKFPDFSVLTTNIAKMDALNRLATLGGFARVYHFENKSWPALERNEEFRTAAGKAAVDPADAGLMRSKQLPGGSICYYSIGPDGIDNGGDETEDVILIVNPPGLKTK
jgi:hypothetical protein